jgi:plastocyanin
LEELSLRKRYLPLVALLGAALAVIPAMANTTGPSTATVSGLESLMWSPMEVAITPGGTVTFQDTTGSVPHGVVWKSGPETPACNGVPIDEGRTDWKGTCTFSKEGTYTYYCYVHGMKMSGTIYVNPNGTVPTATTPTTPMTTTTTMAPAPITPTPTGTSPAGGGPAGGKQSPSPADSLNGGSVRLAARQRGNSIRGSVLVAQNGSMLTVEVLAGATQLAAAHHRQLAGVAQLATTHHQQVRIGRLARSSLPAGRVAFAVALDAHARRVLRQRRHLTVTVRLTVTAPGGRAATRAVPVALRSARSL